MGPAVAQVPPPVTALDVPPPPAGATKVPEPVSVICEPSLASAAAIPPALTGIDGVVKSTLTMSQRTWAAWPKATGTVVRIDNNTAAIPRSHPFVVCLCMTSLLLRCLTQVTSLPPSSSSALLQCSDIQGTP